jgi:hypothetical protein
VRRVPSGVNVTAMLGAPVGSSFCYDTSRRGVDHEDLAVGEADGERRRHRERTRSTGGRVSAR